MADENLTQPGTRVNENLWETFREDVKQRNGGVRGHLRHELETAIREYINASQGGDTHDRLRRLENNVDEIAEQVGTLVDDSERKKNKDSGVSETVQNRLDAIESQIEREIGDATKAHVSVVNKAIEDNAGSSRPTLERYKEMLEQRHVAHEWPGEESDTWWFDNEQFVRVVDKEFDYYELTERYGGDWYDSMLDRIEDETNTPGFQ